LYLNLRVNILWLRHYPTQPRNPKDIVMPRQRKATAKPTPTTEATVDAQLTTTKQMTPSRVIRQAVILDQKATAETIEAALVAAGFSDTKKTTISTVRADTMATLREVQELGLLKSPPRAPRRHDADAAGETVAAEV
jgi:hypothetical protein